MEALSKHDQIQADEMGSSRMTASQTIGLIALGLGRFRVMSEHEHRLEWEREYRQRSGN